MPTFNLADLFESVADVLPHEEALVCGHVRLSYAGLDERATRLAHALAERGVGAGDWVGLHLYNGNEYLEGMLACYKLRAVPVNVNYRYVEDELRYLFDDADLVAVVHEEDFGPTIDAVRPHLPRLQATLARGTEYEAALAAASPERDFPPRSPDDLYVLYTGGTTGLPKGVLWRHEDIFFGAFGGGNAGGPPVAAPEQVAVNARTTAGRTRMLPASPFMHGSAHWMAFLSFFGGGTVVVSPERHLDPQHLWSLVEQERVSFLVIVGDAFARPLVDALRAEPDRWDLSALTVLLSGGAILSPATKDALSELLATTIVVDGFGSSETGGHGQMVSGPGRPGPPRFSVNEDTTVLSDDHEPLQPGDGRVGWLARRGRIPLGYHKDPDKTARTFPVVDGVRWAVPGDRATIEDDGTITVFGRGSVSINSGGEKIFPEEVEAALKAEANVADAVVVGVPDERWGERVVAVLSLRDPSRPPDLDDVRAHCQHHLARYKLPRALVVVDQVVRSPSGKPDYRWARSVALTRLGSSAP